MAVLGCAETVCRQAALPQQHVCRLLIATAFLNVLQRLFCFEHAIRLFQFSALVYSRDAQVSVVARIA